METQLREVKPKIFYSCSGLKLTDFNNIILFILSLIYLNIRIYRSASDTHIISGRMEWERSNLGEGINHWKAILVFD